MTKVPCHDGDSPAVGCSGSVTARGECVVIDGLPYFRGTVHVNGKLVFCDTIHCPIYEPMQVSSEPVLTQLVRLTLGELEGGHA